MLAVEIMLKNNTKIIISTCNRVGTLGLNNAEEILKAVSTLMRKKSAKKVILAGDCNFPHINWSDGTGVSIIDNKLINSFAECGMVQCIHSSTHNKGSILDILLSKSKNHVCNLKVLNDNRTVTLTTTLSHSILKLNAFVVIFPSRKCITLTVPS